MRYAATLSFYYGINTFLYMVKYHLYDAFMRDTLVHPVTFTFSERYM